ncbi:SprB repeat-containing protein [Christiangramia fulva]|nr:SprB repeat-containing protein [Christiangramia fulva]
MIMAWTPASDVPDNQCPITPESIESKCRGVAELKVDTPLGGVVDSVTPVTCNGDGDGSISITASGGKAPYTFAWTMEEDALFSSSSEDLSNLSGGTYNCIITDANNCTFQLQDILVGEPLAVSVTTSSTNVSCNGENDGAITVTGGTYDNLELWKLTTEPDTYTKVSSPTFSSGVYSGLMPGKYKVKGLAADGNGTADACSAFSTPETISEPAAVSVTTSSTNVSCNGENDGTITVTGGTYDNLELWKLTTEPDTYTKVSSPTFSSGVYSGLMPGKYKVKGLAADGNGTADACSAFSTPETISEPAAVSVTTSSTNVSCNGENDGTITVTGGTYDNLELWKLTTEPDTYTKVSSPTFSSGVYSGLMPGKYKVKGLAADGNGTADACSAFSTPETISEPAAVSVTTSSTNVSCNGENDGTITVTGGTYDNLELWKLTTEPDTYTKVSSPTFSSGVYSGLMPGKYKVKGLAADGNGTTDACSAFSTPETISEPAAVSVTTSSTNVSCNGENDGTITVTGGTYDNLELWKLTTEPDTYTKVSSPTFSSGVYSGLMPGKYKVKGLAADGNGTADACSAFSTPETISEPAAVSVTTSSTNVSCNGENDGTITVTGGTYDNLELWKLTTEPDTYTKVSSPTFSSGVYSGLMPGKYKVKGLAADGNGTADACSAFSTPETISEPAAVSVTTSSTNVSCNGENDGTITVTGGTYDNLELWKLTTEPDTYTKVSSPTFSSGVYSGLMPGKYKVKGLAADGNGTTDACSAFSTPETITEPAKVKIPNINTQQSDCIGGIATTKLSYDDTSITEFYYRYKDATDENAEWTSWLQYTTTSDPISLGVGSYTFQVKYTVDGCLSDEFPVNIGIPQDAELTVTTHGTTVDCSTGTGSIIVDNISDLTGVKFTLYRIIDTENSEIVQPYQDVDYPTNGFTGLTPGNYFVSAVSTFGCPGNDLVTLEVPQCLTCETAFAKDEYLSNCFLDDPVLNSERWGWTNLYEKGQSYTLNLYEGADHCDATTDRKVGQVEVIPNGDLIDVTFTVNDNHIMSSVHLYVGCDPYPSKKQKGQYEYTVAPGQYNFNAKGDIGYRKTYSIKGIEITQDTYYLIAHIDVCTSETQGYIEELRAADDGTGSTTYNGRQAEMASCDVTGTNGRNSKTSAQLTLSSTSTQSLTETSEPIFKVAPVPFSDQLNIGYIFDYTSDVTIEVFDMNGRLLKTYRDKAVNSDSMSTFNVTFRTFTGQQFILRMTTDREVYSAQVIAK